MSDVEKERIRQLALSCGFKLKEQADGSQDLNEYVYAFAKDIENAAYERSKKAVAETEINSREYYGDDGPGTLSDAVSNIDKLKSSPAGE